MINSVCPPLTIPVSLYQASITAAPAPKPLATTSGVFEPSCKLNQFELDAICCARACALADNEAFNDTGFKPSWARLAFHALIVASALVEDDVDVDVADDVDVFSTVAA